MSLGDFKSWVQPFSAHFHQLQLCVFADTAAEANSLHLKYWISNIKQLVLSHLESTRWSIVRKWLFLVVVFFFFLPSSFVCPLLHHLISIILYTNAVSLHSSYTFVHFQPNTQTYAFLFPLIYSDPCPPSFLTTSEASLITSPVSVSPPIFPSLLPPLASPLQHQ